MSSSDHRRLWHARVKEVLFEASQLELAARSVFLREACAGDQELRDEIESLLAYHEALLAEAPKLDGPLPDAEGDGAGTFEKRKLSR